MARSGPEQPEDRLSIGRDSPAQAIEVDPDEFVALVTPVLAKRDARTLLEFLKSHWNKDQFIALIRLPHEDARKVAALCLSLVGQSCCVPDISQLLKDSDPCVNQIAEHALWSIWFRAGTDEANHQLHRGAQALGRRDFLHAISHFDKAIQLCPDFAEAYNQRAIAQFLLEEYEGSLRDCREVTKRMPQHFGAWAGTGHNLAHMGDFRGAIDAYERALSINPYMHAIRDTVRDLRAKLET